jgi:hypothetical protein
MYTCMECSFCYGAPAFVHEAAGSNQPILPPFKRKCPRCKGTQVRLSKELNQEITEVVSKYLKTRYPLYTFRPVFETKAGSSG